MCELLSVKWNVCCEGSSTDERGVVGRLVHGKLLSADNTGHLPTLRLLSTNLLEFCSCFFYRLT